MTAALDEVVVQLAAMARMPSHAIDPDRPLQELEVDSAALVEWLYQLEEAFDVDLFDEFLEGIETLSIRELAERLASK